MFFSVALLSLAALASAAPARRASTITDTDVLQVRAISSAIRCLTRIDMCIARQFALTLEHLEDNFYSTGLAKYDEKAFTDAGFPAFARGRFEEIAAHEHSHVELLTAALGSVAVQPCTYSFPDNDVASFVALSSIFEGVGTSAYLGAGGLLKSKSTLTVAASILTTEARQQAWGKIDLCMTTSTTHIFSPPVKSAVLKAQPWSGPNETPLDINQAFSLAAGFIKSCPSTNAPLVAKAFPPVTASPPNAPSGTKVTFTFKSKIGQPYWAAFLSGLTTKIVKLDSKKTATVPDGLLGTYYTVIVRVSRLLLCLRPYAYGVRYPPQVTSPSTTVTDAHTVAGGLVSVVDFYSNTDDTPN